MACIFSKILIESENENNYKNFALYQLIVALTFKRNYKLCLGYLLFYIVPQIGSVEKQLDSMDLRAEKKLVLLHRPDTILPKNTADWLNMRGWVSSHHHIKCAKRIYLRKSPSWFEDYYETTLTKDNAVDKFSDFRDWHAC